MGSSRVLSVATAALLLLPGCATPFTDTWMDPAWKGPPLRSVLVVGETRTEVGRRAYEDAMCERLARIGVRCEPSYRMIAVLGQDEVARSVASGGEDGLILARLVGVEQREQLVSTPMSGGHVGWRTWSGFYSQTTVRINQVARIETQVWSVAGEGSMIWAGT